MSQSVIYAPWPPPDSVVLPDLPVGSWGADPWHTLGGICPCPGGPDWEPDDSPNPLWWLPQPALMTPPTRSDDKQSSHLFEFYLQLTGVAVGPNPLLTSQDPVQCALRAFPASHEVIYSLLLLWAKSLRPMEGSAVQRAFTVIARRLSKSSSYSGKLHYLKYCSVHVYSFIYPFYRYLLGVSSALGTMLGEEEWTKLFIL